MKLELDGDSMRESNSTLCVELLLNLDPYALYLASSGTHKHVKSWSKIARGKP